MASLSWKERQLIEETQNEGMMEGLWQTLPKDKGFRKLLDDKNSVAISTILLNNFYLSKSTVLLPGQRPA